VSATHLDALDDWARRARVEGEVVELLDGASVERSGRAAQPPPGSGGEDLVKARIPERLQHLGRI
jgi:hypothetical protein